MLFITINKKLTYKRAGLFKKFKKNDTLIYRLKGLL